MNRNFKTAINEQMEQLVKNIQSVSDYIDEDLIAKDLCKWPL